LSHAQIDSELCVRHEEGAAVCGRAGLPIGPINRSSTTRTLVRQLVSSCSRGRSGTANFLVKVKLHRGEGADILADKAIPDPKVVKKWCQQTNRVVFTLEKPCREAGKTTYQDRPSTFNNSVSDAIRRGAAENEVPKHGERLTGAWRQLSTFRRRYERWCKGDNIEALGLMTENS